MPPDGGPHQRNPTGVVIDRDTAAHPHRTTEMEEGPRSQSRCRGCDPRTPNAAPYCPPRRSWAWYLTVTLVRMPPRGVNAACRVIQRGCETATRSSRILLVTFS
jgi:hypothetical protein